MRLTITRRQIFQITLASVGAVVAMNYERLLPHRWETYTAPDNAFLIELPAKPRIETIQAPREDGGGTVIINAITAAPTSHTSYSCDYTERDHHGGESSDKILESARDGSLRKTQGTVLNQRRITVQGYPGLEMQVSARGDSLVDERLLVVGERLYMIIAVATIKQDRESKTIQRVFDSFKINQE
jgi:hypothetical protein